MADSPRDKEYLGIDTSVLVAYLDYGHPSHHQTEKLRRRAVALNPTIVHEAYHSLVFKMKWNPTEARETLEELVTDKSMLFLNQTLQTTRVGLHLAVKYGLGGRDALILANLLNSNVPEIVTFDQALTKLKSISHRERILKIRSP